MIDAIWRSLAVGFLAIYAANLTSESLRRRALGQWWPEGFFGLCAVLAAAGAAYLAGVR